MGHYEDKGVLSNCFKKGEQMKLIKDPMVTITLVAIMLLHVSTAFGWTLKIKNSTKHKAWIAVEYDHSWCRTDNVTVDGGNTISVDAKSCTVMRVTGVISTTPGNSGGNVTLRIKPGAGLAYNPKSRIDGKDFAVEIVYEDGTYWLAKRSSL